MKRAWRAVVALVVVLAVVLAQPGVASATSSPAFQEGGASCTATATTVACSSGNAAYGYPGTYSTPNTASGYISMSAGNKSYEYVGVYALGSNGDMVTTTICNGCAGGYTVMESLWTSSFGQAANAQTTTTNTTMSGTMSVTVPSSGNVTFGYCSTSACTPSGLTMASGSSTPVVTLSTLGGSVTGEGVFLVNSAGDTMTYSGLSGAAGTSPTTTTPAYNGPTASQESGFFSSLGGIFTGGLSSVASAISAIGSGIESAVNGIGSAITGALSSVGNLITQGFNGVVGFIEQALTYLFVPASSTDPIAQSIAGLNSTEPFSTITTGVNFPFNAINAVLSGVQNPSQCSGTTCTNGPTLDVKLPSIGKHAMPDINLSTIFAPVVPTGAEQDIRSTCNWFITVFFIYGVTRTLLGVISKSKD